MKDFFSKSIKTLSEYKDKALENIVESASLVASKIDGLPIIASLEKIQPSKSVLYDEKHYFVIPYKLSPFGFALHTMRCLPDSVPEINSLPKRRIFHFANESAEYALRHYMLNSAKEIVEEKNQESLSSLESLANGIDSLDRKLTYGMLLVGGIAAIFNPILGAGIAAKAVMPSVTGLLNKYGIKPVGEKMTKMQLEAELKKAEKRVEKEFSESSTIKVINPILAELDLALRTTEDEHDPLTDPNLADGSISELDNDDWRLFTETAICRVYKEVYSNADQHASAGLGPEDIRWLKVMYDVQNNSK